MRGSALVVCCLSTSLITGCAGSSFESVLKTGGSLWGNRGQAASIPKNLDPKLSYKRVFAEGKVAFIVLGEVDSTPEGMVQTWYSRRSETLRFLNGRIISTNGLPLNWVRSSIDGAPPVWRNVIEPVTYTRRLDLMPGYRFNVLDRLEVRRLTEPPVIDPRWMSMPQDQRQRLIWFEERIVQGTLDTPPTWIATLPIAGSLVPVFGRQCISLDFCIAWERVNPRQS